MAEYYSIRLWQLKPGCSATELEDLVESGLLEIQPWIPGVKHLSLVRLEGEPAGRYLLLTTFTGYEAYLRWRQVEEEASDYWERYAAILTQWEHLSQLVREYAGEMAVDAKVGDA